MNFFDWMFKTSRQKLLQSYDEYWRCLVNTSSCSPIAVSMTMSINRYDEYVHLLVLRGNSLISVVFSTGVFPVERKISRKTKVKNTLDVDVFFVIYRHHWVHSTFFRHGNMIVQFATVQLWSAITGTRPGVLLPQNSSLPDGSSLGRLRPALPHDQDTSHRQSRVETSRTRKNKPLAPPVPPLHPQSPRSPVSCTNLRPQSQPGHKAPPSHLIGRSSAGGPSGPPNPFSNSPP
jgi:hypothetical protein